MDILGCKQELEVGQESEKGLSEGMALDLGSRVKEPSSCGMVHLGQNQRNS